MKNRYSYFAIMKGDDGLYFHYNRSWEVYTFHWINDITRAKLWKVEHYAEKKLNHINHHFCSGNPHDLRGCKLVEFQLKEVVAPCRPDWEDYFLGMAIAVSKRSHDGRTKHGCVLVKNNKIIGCGYNGFPRGMIDGSLPNLGEDKYKWMTHSEVNAVTNAVCSTDGATAYITGKPCNACLIHLWQNGVANVVHVNAHGSHKKEVFDKEQRDLFLSQTGMDIKVVEPNLKWLLTLM